MATSSSSPDLPVNIVTGSAVADKPNKGQSPKPQRAQAEAADDQLLEEDSRGFLGRFFTSGASWMTSLIVHMVIIIALALMIVPMPPQVTALLSSAPSEDINDEVLDVPDVDFSEVDVEITPEEIVDQPDVEAIEEVVKESLFEDQFSAPPAAVELSDFGLTSAPEVATAGIGSYDEGEYTGRGHAARAKAVRDGGGNASSEAAVEAALAWLAEHQNRDGSWHLDHRGGTCQGQCGNPGSIEDSYRSATALALLPFLGAGQTRFEGKYRSVVGRGLDALVRMGEKPRQGAGVSWADGGTMYAHGIAAIAMCEAYGMTNESQLAMPAQAAIDYIVSSQNPNDGGWRYNYQMAGDTSVTGWQLMALKSAHLANLQVPHSTVEGAMRFLDFVEQDDYGSAYAYMPEGKNGGYRPGMSSVGLLCRMYLGWKKDSQGITQGVERIANVGPSASDYYYNYYAAQLLFQYTNGRGPMWRQWNERLRDQLIKTQEKEGHLKGSWFVNNGHDSEKGGRLYCTALGCMTLEVYYRHMPIYRTDAVEMEFPE
ncbi:prenyltransferase/squalene oxidase repeat-containing protein [Aeoliella mucimassa]|uniref:Prenyltransferase and squalene oxidase repeat protein n=1 Tax=Aeoliella mucimassa TaxID=2527972 RepID=A0A518AWK4_9BACT|nr:prenyltransferase/squalene oxidase repeat-containing protein [Aeoliella mucimassa]QDU59096.1 Prenyltransferase and squalene oxidase repeat protein [Aeoliella mucimassa]